MRKKQIGFVGLGLMGSGMTKNLLSAGYSVIGYDIEEGKVDALVRRGGRRELLLSRFLRASMLSSCPYRILMW